MTFPMVRNVPLFVEEFLIAPKHAFIHVDDTRIMIISHGQRGIVRHVTLCTTHAPHISHSEWMPFIIITIIIIVVGILLTIKRLR